jgi:hypothetical protein
VAFGWQASLVDFFRNELISYSEGKQDFTEDEIQKSRDSLNKLKDVKGKRIKRFILSSYITYSTIQVKMQPKLIKDDIDLSKHSIKNNQLILRLWCANGTATPKFISIFCCFFNRLDIFIAYILIFGTLWSILLLVLQKINYKKMRMSTT